MLKNHQNWDEPGIGFRQLLETSKSDLYPVFNDLLLGIDQGKEQLGLFNGKALAPIYRDAYVGLHWREPIDSPSDHERHREAVELLIDRVHTIHRGGGMVSTGLGDTLRFLKWLRLDRWQVTSTTNEKPDPRRPWHFSNSLRVFNSLSGADVDRALEYIGTRAASGEYAVLVGLHAATNRRSSGVTEVRTIFVDLDDMCPKNLPLKPTVVVESSRRRYHAYFRLTTPVSGREGHRLSLALTRLLGGDPNCHEIAGAALSVPLPGVPRARFGKVDSTPKVVDWDGPEYDPGVLWDLCGGRVASAPASVLMQAGERLTAHEAMTQWKKAEALILTAVPGERLAKIKLACLLVAPYARHGIDRRIAGRLVNLCRRRWPECDETIVTTVRKMFRKPYSAEVPPERLKARQLKEWAGEQYLGGQPVIYAEAILARPDGTTEREAQRALGKIAETLGWKVKRLRYKGATSSTAQPEYKSPNYYEIGNKPIL